MNSLQDTDQDISRTKPKLVAIAAMARNRVIGREGKLPWHLPEDLKFFKRTTIDHAILFGKTTFLGLGRALPRRTNFVLSRSLAPQENIHILRSVAEVEKLDLPLIFICGGAEIYRKFFPICHELLLTRVEGDYKGDTTLPVFEDLFSLSEILMKGNGYTIERWKRN
jgi:dihydrofolate reductase